MTNSTNTSARRSTRISALSLLTTLSFAMLAGTAARAGEIAGAPVAHQVKLADLDLTTDAGRQIAEQRIRQAARLVCTRVADELDLSHHENFIKCVDSAVTTAGARLQAQLNQQAPSKLAQADVK